MMELQAREYQKTADKALDAKTQGGRAVYRVQKSTTCQCHSLHTLASGGAGKPGPISELQSVWYFVMTVVGN